MTLSLTIIPVEEFQRIRGNEETPERIALLADMCRLNTLTAIKRAGSGHIGSSLSSMDIVAALYFRVMNTATVGVDHPDRDIYFSSKGHDAPGMYAVLNALGIVSTQSFLDLRRISGVPGHPDVCTVGVEANTGSLGMGISKAKGMVLAKRLSGNGGKLYVMTGDGELQEGQIYESLQGAVHHRMGELTVLVDHNKVQSDRLVSETSDLADLDAKFAAFGWVVRRCDGHDVAALLAILSELDTILDRPKVIICDTIKGRGVSFMEHPVAMAGANGFYRYHSGAPSDDDYRRAIAELAEVIAKRASALGLTMPAKVTVEAATPNPPHSGVFVSDGYGQALLDLAERHPEMVVLDADLAIDCRVQRFKETFPKRFFECGIAEQDMVAMAGGLALQGYRPVVNSFACFLASRAIEQIYTNACERTPIVYVNHYAGLLPAGPGASHQSLRDVALYGSLPDCVVIQPCTKQEAAMATEWVLARTEGPSMLRLNIGPSPVDFSLPDEYRLTFGRGVELAEGTDALAIAYGPVLLNELLEARALLAAKGLSLAVVNMPWLNRIDESWLTDLVAPHSRIFVVDDHHHVGSLGGAIQDRLVSTGLLKNRTLQRFAVEGVPACGTAAEALRAHGLDRETLAQQISKRL